MPFCGHISEEIFHFCFFYASTDIFLIACHRRQTGITLHLPSKYFLINTHLQLHWVVSFTGIANVQPIRPVTPSGLTHAASWCFQSSDPDTSHLNQRTDGRQLHSSAGLFSSDRRADGDCRFWPPKSLHPFGTVWNRSGDTHRLPSTPTPASLSPRKAEYEKEQMSAKYFSSNNNNTSGMGIKACRK